MGGKVAVVNQRGMNFVQNIGYIFNAVNHSIPVQTKLFEDQIAPADKVSDAILPEFDLTEV